MIKRFLQTMFPYVWPQLQFPPPPESLTDLFMQEKLDMRNAMLSGGHSWEDTKSAINEEYPNKKFDELRKFDEKLMERWHAIIKEYQEGIDWLAMCTFCTLLDSDNFPIKSESSSFPNSFCI